ncbi:hypothetical protein D0Y65_046759 [Glycine soja]|uniref:Uncharacterized protein n=1 Tax=Glycine soja TaxID=3848 RepID=A0A445GAS4_GLYSO|nr:hypothetical protein D0Y65_046759 [Glycine soja]RZB58295.1 hypothetical protein D0Y65_046759 [Glycine soja]
MICVMGQQLIYKLNYKIFYNNRFAARINLVFILFTLVLDILCVNCLFCYIYICIYSNLFF